jgi:hypothetical protein
MERHDLPTESDRAWPPFLSAALPELWCFVQLLAVHYV